MPSKSVIERPAAGEYDKFYTGYVALVPEADVIEVLARQTDDVAAAAKAFMPDRESHAYAPGKWTVRELFGHLTDAERVFGYRAVCIARGDKASFPGFDEQVYVARSGFSGVPLRELVEEFELLRKANLAAFRRHDVKAWQEVGRANDTAVSLRALPFIMAGHVRHHLKVLGERYAQAAPAAP
jgi:hypothetical protein